MIYGPKKFASSGGGFFTPLEWDNYVYLLEGGGPGVATRQVGEGDASCWFQNWNNMDVTTGSPRRAVVTIRGFQDRALPGVFFADMLNLPQGAYPHNQVLRFHLPTGKSGDVILQWNVEAVPLVYFQPAYPWAGPRIGDKSFTEETLGDFQYTIESVTLTLHADRDDTGTADCWSRGHLEDPTLESGAVLVSALGDAGSEAVIESIIGTAQAGTLAMDHYDLLIFARTPGATTFDPDTDLPLTGYRVSAAAVGVSPTALLDIGTPANLLLADTPLTLPWGSYWLILSTVCAPDDGTPAHRSNNDVAQHLIVPDSITDGAPFEFALDDPALLAGLTTAGLSAQRIAPDHVAAFRVNRAEWIR